MVKGLTITNETKLHDEYSCHQWFKGLTITDELLDLTPMSLNNEGRQTSYHVTMVMARWSMFSSSSAFKVKWQ